MPLLGREPGTHAIRDLVENPDDETVPGVAVLGSTAACSSRQVRDVVEADGVLDYLRPNHVHATLKTAIDTGLGAAAVPME